MSLNRKKTLYRIAVAFLILTASLYLTFIVDVYTLNTWPKKVFVFAYFIIMSGLLYLVRSRYLGREKLGCLLATAVIAALVLALFQDTFLPPVHDQQITIQANRAETAPIGEVWLTGIEIDGIFYEVSAFETIASQGWEYKADTDDYVYYPKDDNIYNCLTLEITADRVDLCFASNPWSGSVEIKQQEEQGFLTLYSETVQDDTLHYVAGSAREYSLAERIVLNAGAVIVLSFVLSTLFLFHSKKTK